ncbi:hypothetical protein [Aliarcobacter cryaerophilus]|uniref:hypothetical protein n=1 Tax=Aliarcobacter cryaerophilus TaxID=28198 RepID=UPI00083490A9|nr:hypothetical protein [Aliarcobacter cryaerophilus]
MPEFIALVVVIIATIYVFIKVKNGLQNKGKSKPASIFLAFISSFFAFIIFMVLASSFFEDSKKQTQTQEPKQEIKTTQKEVKSNERIEATIATKITLDIVNSLKDNYNIEAGIFEDMPLYLDKLCSSDTACQIYASKTQIQVVYKTVEALTSSKVSPQYYQNVCSAILIGLTDANKDLSEDIITQAFDYASKNGSAKSETLGVEITIKPDSSNNLLGCSFYKN